MHCLPRSPVAEPLARRWAAVCSTRRRSLPSAATQASTGTSGSARDGLSVRQDPHATGFPFLGRMGGAALTRYSMRVRLAGRRTPGGGLLGPGTRRWFGSGSASSTNTSFPSRGSPVTSGGSTRTRWSRSRSPTGWVSTTSGRSSTTSWRSTATRRRRRSSSPRPRSEPSHIRLGHGIVQIPPPVNHPARVAERIATLDLISGGRVDFGTGEASSAAELSGFGVPGARSGPCGRSAWSDHPDVRGGALRRLALAVPPDAPRNVIPKTVQKPHPPLWVACSRRETIHLAARNGIGALSFSFVTPQEAARWSGEYYALLASEECLPAGFAVNPNLAVVLPMMCHEDLETARERGVQGANFFGYALAHYYGPSKTLPGARRHLVLLHPAGVRRPRRRWPPGSAPPSS